MKTFQALFMVGISILSMAIQSKLKAQEFGVHNSEVSKISDTGHSLQVWEVLPDFTQNGSYEVSIKHTVAGQTGSFYITAWTDTNADGIPDKEIGRSELKTAINDGDWSSWTFSNNYDKIFVGNTWSITNEKMYYQSGGSIDHYTGLSTKVFYSRTFNGTPSQTTSPRFTNIRVKIIDNSTIFGTTGAEVHKVEDTGHQMQVWEILPDYTRHGTYEVSIKHGVAGAKGAFFIIAWADANNDGIPDTEIGRSELKTATKDGEWSTWSFETNYNKIFVGNMWSTSDEKVYYQSGGKLQGYIGLSDKVFYSRTFNGMPTQYTQPRYTNIKVQFK